MPHAASNAAQLYLHTRALAACLSALQPVSFGGGSGGGSSSTACASDTGLGAALLHAAGSGGGSGGEGGGGGDSEGGGDQGGGGQGGASEVGGDDDGGENTGVDGLGGGDEIEGSGGGGAGKGEAEGSGDVPAACRPDGGRGPENATCSCGAGTSPCARESVLDALPAGPQPTAPRVRSNTSAGAAAPRAGTANRAEGAEARASVQAPTSSNMPAAANARHVARCATGESLRPIVRPAASSARLAGSTASTRPTPSTTSWGRCPEVATTPVSSAHT